ncbi:family 1 encapsulin nanocompartment shell protein [Propionimicrobium sp. PCR01-08-3]|uniref:family 1 encapsulin nanocompartment shell protein n=1 Tax=Propionimicrobium sp. PCR01-08-3 TaxID=3052086 RepID=UPI00255CFC56|nr:family 1 encapsulin nanocompartment shell protein [Propionimicrobium sp. PCR01-08-3]WIY83286.1 family 1 encapsulin nanocompartment shell protein [Propionimicrobium sp. PCR01-08-3]
MNNLHRELAPISEAAWAQIEEEARRTYTRWIAGRRVVDVTGPDGEELSAVGTGHLRPLDEAEDGVITRQREVRQVIELRVPFTVTRAAVDDVVRGAQDSDWQPVKDAVQQIALAEDRAVFHGLASAAIEGIAQTSSNDPIVVPEDVRDVPEAVAHAVSELRLAGVDGPYTLLLSADLYTKVSETTDQGYPVSEHLARVLDGEVMWAPALKCGGVLLTTRGGDYELHLGQDLSIGYWSHDANGIELYLQESFTFLSYTAEASVVLSSVAK